MQLYCSTSVLLLATCYKAENKGKKENQTPPLQFSAAPSGFRQCFQAGQPARLQGTNEIETTGFAAAVVKRHSREEKLICCEVQQTEDSQ